MKVISINIHSQGGGIASHCYDGRAICLALPLISSYYLLLLEDLIFGIGAAYLYKSPATLEDVQCVPVLLDNYVLCRKSVKNDSRNQRQLQGRF